MKRILIALFILITLPARAAVDIEKVTSPGGLTAWLVEEHSIPFVALELRFVGGASLDRPGKRGAVNLMTGLIEEGAGDLDARGFAEAREALAASLGFDVGDDAVSVSAKMLTENRDAAVALLRSALTAPRFDPDAVERVRAQVISHLKSRETDPNAIAAATLDAMAYGDHPYGSYYGGSIDSVSALSREDIQTAFGDVIARDRVYISAVGDITPEELGALMDRVLGDLPEDGAALPEPVVFGATGGITVVDFPSPQSVAQFAQPGIGLEDPDFFAAYVLSTILGGPGFNSRLMDEVREKRGLTYGISTYLVDNEFSNSVVGAVQSINPRMAETVGVVRAEWERIAAGVSEEELAAAKLYLTGAYPLRWDGNGPIASILVSMQTSGYDIDYPKTRNDKLNAVTLDDINRVAKRLFRPEDLRFVVVGQPEGLTSSD